MLKNVLFIVCLSIIYAPIFSQNPPQNAGFKVGLGGAGVSFNGNHEEYSSQVSFLAGFYKDWPINQDQTWFFNVESWFNYAQVGLSNGNSLNNYNLIIPFGFKYSKNQKASFSFGLAPTYTFASSKSNDVGSYSLPRYGTNNQNGLVKTEFITSPVTVQFRLGGNFAFNETYGFGVEFLKYFSGRTYYNYNSFGGLNEIDLNNATIVICLTKKLRN